MSGIEIICVKRNTLNRGAATQTWGETMEMLCWWRQTKLRSDCFPFGDGDYAKRHKIPTSRDVSRLPEFDAFIYVGKEKFLTLSVYDHAHALQALYWTEFLISL